MQKNLISALFVLKKRQISYMVKIECKRCKSEGKDEGKIINSPFARLKLEEKIRWYTISDSQLTEGVFCLDCLPFVRDNYKTKIFTINDEKLFALEHICPWCNKRFELKESTGFILDHYYHFHGEDKGKCSTNFHKKRDSDNLSSKLLVTDEKEYIGKNFFKSNLQSVVSQSEKNHKELLNLLNEQGKWLRTIMLLLAFYAFSKFFIIVIRKLFSKKKSKNKICASNH